MVVVGWGGKAAGGESFVLASLVQPVGWDQETFSCDGSNALVAARTSADESSLSCLHTKVPPFVALHLSERLLQSHHDIAHGAE